MKDVELLILKSFAYAVMQQRALPDAIRQQIKLIAASFNTRVAELDALARSSSLLASDYRWAYSALTNSAAERGMGIDFVPADYDEDGPSHESGNIVSAPERHQLDEARAMLDAVDSRVNQAKPQALALALSSDNPYQALTNLVTLQ